MKPYACAQCGNPHIAGTRYADGSVGWGYADMRKTCPRCGNRGPLARMTPAKQQETWAKYQAMVKNTQG